MAVIIVAMMAATVLERLHGTPEALRWVYHNPVFMILWAVAALSGLFYLLEIGTQKRFFTFLLHVSFLFILLGALVTFLFGESGTISLREGEIQSAYEQDSGDTVTLPFGIRLEEFAIDYYPGSQMPSDYRSAITFMPEGRAVQISMNHIAKYQGYRFYQADYDEDLKGSILSVSHDPWGVGITYTGYILLLLSMLGFFFQKDTAFRASLQRVLQEGRKSRLRRFLLWTFAVLAIALCVLLILQLGIFGKPLMPVLRSPLLYIHVISIMMSYTVFLLVALIGVVGVCAPSAETRERLKDVSLSILYPGVFLLTFGTFLGAVWANISWGNYWAWDPKETWALITLLVYSFALHGGVLKPFRNARFFHWFAIGAILCVLITYFGVNLILGGMHSYA